MANTQLRLIDMISGKKMTSWNSIDDQDNRTVDETNSV